MTSTYFKDAASELVVESITVRVASYDGLGTLYASMKRFPVKSLTYRFRF
jgi:hypothetical protein